MPSPLASLFSSGDFIVRNSQITQRFLPHLGLSAIKPSHIAMSDFSLILIPTVSHSWCNVIYWLGISNIKLSYHFSFTHLTTKCLIFAPSERYKDEKWFSLRQHSGCGIWLAHFPITQHAPVVVALLNVFTAIIDFDSLKDWCFVSFYSAEESWIRLVQLVQHFKNAGYVK